MPRKKSSKPKKKRTVKRVNTGVSSTNVRQLQSIAAQMEKVSMNLVQSNHLLVSRVDKLVGLFETAVKNIGITDKDVTDKESIKELSHNIEDLLEQNKNLAEGLLLLERYVRNKAADMRTLDAKPLPRV